jgi:excisionase family DNA binding protein
MLLRAEEAATLLGIGRTKVFEMLAAGDLPAIRIGRCVRISRDQLDRWIYEQLERSGFIRRSPADEPRRPDRPSSPRRIGA